MEQGRTGREKRQFLYRQRKQKRDSFCIDRGNRTVTAEREANFYTYHTIHCAPRFQSMDLFVGVGGGRGVQPDDGNAGSVARGGERRLGVQRGRGRWGEAKMEGENVCMLVSLTWRQIAGLEGRLERLESLVESSLRTRSEQTITEKVNVLSLRLKPLDASEELLQGHAAVELGRV
eukprot:749892-Hanusia_phi.AAC.1